jgi:hypothetical protein
MDIPNCFHVSPRVNIGVVQLVYYIKRANDPIATSVAEPEPLNSNILLEPKKFLALRQCS